jgi:hypothetical protein
MYKGAPTNNLVMLLTNPNKQIASGAISRKEAYAMVKYYGLQQAILDGEGENYTRVKTDVLEEYIEQYQNIRNSSANEEEVLSASPESTGVRPVTAPHANTVNWIYDGIKALLADGTFFNEDVYVLNELITELSHRLHEATPSITDADIDDMLASL